MEQFTFLSEVRLVCLIPPGQVSTLSVTSRETQFEEFKTWLNRICQLTTNPLDDQELEQFLDWSELPWHILQASQMKWCEDFIIEAVRQYQQLMENGSQAQGLELQAPFHVSETTLRSISSDLDSLTEPLGEHQTDAGEDSAALAKTLVAELQAMMPLLERWQKYLEANALFGTLHPYPKCGMRWNYYPPADEVKREGKDKRRYVKKKDLEEYQRRTALGSHLKQVKALEQQLITVLSEIQSLL